MMSPPPLVVSGDGYRLGLPPIRRLRDWQDAQAARLPISIPQNRAGEDLMQTYISRNVLRDDYIQQLGSKLQKVIKGGIDVVIGS
jgi:hypothetical protein